MKFSLALLALGVESIFAQTVQTEGTTTGGDGPHAPAAYTTDSTLAKHTIYVPKTIPNDTKLGVLVWGEGGCIAEGLSFLAMLTEIASHGILVLASGAPGGGTNAGSTTYQQLTQSIDWITTGAGKQKYPTVDSTRIAVAGQSCGGLEAFDLVNDTRVSAFGIFNSGAFTMATSTAPQVSKPIFFFLGGSTDIAYANGERDYGLVPKTTPAWKGNLNGAGHEATYSQKNGGVFGNAAVHFFNWVLRGNATAGTYFTGTGAATDGWNATSHTLDSIKTTPI